MDVLIVVEDPGAANFVLELPTELKHAGLSCQILAFGYAWDYLLDREIECLEYPSGFSAKSLVEEYGFRLLLSGTSNRFHFLHLLMNVKAGYLLAFVAAVDAICALRAVSQSINTSQTF